MLNTEKHIVGAIGVESVTAKELGAQTLARLHGLDGKILPHGFRNRVKVLASLETLLGHLFDLGASGGLSVDCWYRLPRSQEDATQDAPVLEPDLDRPFGHVNLHGDAFPDLGSGRGVLVKLHLQYGELVLGRSLPLLVLLLLGESTLPGQSLRLRGGMVIAMAAGRRRRWRLAQLGGSR